MWNEEDLCNNGICVCSKMAINLNTWGNQTTWKIICYFKPLTRPTTVVLSSVLLWIGPLQTNRGNFSFLGAYKSTYNAVKTTVDRRRECVAFGLNIFLLVDHRSLKYPSTSTEAEALPFDISLCDVSSGLAWTYDKVAEMSAQSFIYIHFLYT